MESDECSYEQPFHRLSPDLIARVLLKLDLRDICNCARVATVFFHVISEDYRVWLPLCENRWGQKTTVRLWLRKDAEATSTITSPLSAPATNYRDLYRQLQLLERVHGFWTGPSSAPLGSLYLFRWTTCSLEGVQLVSCDNHAFQLRAEPFITLGPAFPFTGAEVLDNRHCILREAPGGPAGTCFSAATAATAAASPGLHTASTSVGLLGSSPERTFGQELERFMSSSVQQPRSGMKKSRKPGGGGTRNPVVTTHHLVRVPQMQPNRKHPLAGLWMGVYGVHGLEVVSVSYDFSGTAAKIVATKVTGDPNVPCEKVTWMVSASAIVPPYDDVETDLLAARVLLDTLAIDAGISVVAIHTGVGRIANAGFQSPSWIDGRLWVFSNGDIGFLWMHPFNSLIIFKRLNISN